ncbi:hypothetical protein [Levilactobacillus cerevisiae]|nr:hypothetical protein [Levilactobacillus cerevisiae]
MLDLVGVVVVGRTGSYVVVLGDRVDDMKSFGRLQASQLSV